VDHAFEHDFGAGRHLQVGADTLHQLGFGTAQQAGELVFAQAIWHRRDRAEDGGRVAAQPYATAHGITLTAADTVVFYGPLTSVEMYLQCIARSDRKGQTAEKVTVIHIQSSPVEERLFKAMGSKVSEQALLVGMFEAELKN
jgi:hypothetical protein